MRTYWILVVLLAITITGTRSYLALSTTEFSDDTAYARLRDTQNILTTGLPIVNDPLVPRPKALINAFEYILAGTALLIPLETAAKIIPNIFAGLLTITYFILTLRLTNAPYPALLATITLSILPDLYARTFNSASALPTTLFLLTLILIGLTGKQGLRMLTLSTTALLITAYTHPSLIIITTGIGLALTLKLLQQHPLTKNEQEYGLFSTFYTLTTYLIIYRTPLAFFGITFLTATIPQELLQHTFENLTILTAVAHLGAFPLTLALKTTYQTLSKNNNPTLLYPIGIGGTAALLTWLKLAPANTSMIFFAYALYILFAEGYKQLTTYLHQTKTAQYTPVIHTILFIIIIIPTLHQLTTLTTQRLSLAPTQEEHTTTEWIAQNTPPTSKILTQPTRAQYIAYKTQRPIIMDTTYYLTPNAHQTYTDIQRFYTTPIEIEAVSIAQKYETNYAYAQPAIPIPRYIPGRCFSLAHSTTIYAKSPECGAPQ